MTQPNEDGTESTGEEEVVTDGKELLRREIEDAMLADRLNAQQLKELQRRAAAGPLRHAPDLTASTHVLDEPTVQTVRGLEHAVRCACVHLSNVCQVSDHAEMAQKVQGTDTTVTYIHRGMATEKSQELMENPGYATLLSYHPDSSEGYFRSVDQYSRAHASPTEGGSVAMGGPGIITMCPVKHLEGYYADRAKWLAANTKQGSDRETRQRNNAIEQTSDTPVFLKVNANQMGNTCSDETMHNIQGGRVHGVIFHDIRDLQTFADWYQAQLAGQSGKTRQEGHMNFREPTLILRGEPGKVRDTIVSGDAAKAHAFMFNKPLSAQQTRELRDARAAMMARSAEAESVPNPFAPNSESHAGGDLPHQLKVGVVHVQGAARLEAAMIAQASRNVPGMSVQLALIQTRQQLEHWNPDALVLPGGWHFLQHNMQEHPEIDINGVLGEIVQAQRMHILGSCAGAILMRQPDTVAKKSEGCVPGTALGILPYRVRNNARSGMHPTQFLIHGAQGEQWTNLPSALYVSAPQLLPEEQADLKIIAQTNEEIYGVIQRSGHNAPVYAATALHNLLPYVYWLHEIHENLAVQRLRGKHGGVEGNIQS
jgi:glutamine amidotransferase PdxT